MLSFALFLMQFLCYFHKNWFSDLFTRHVKCIQKLLENKADIEISNCDGMTAVSTWFIHSLTSLFIHLLTHLIINLFICAPVHSFIYLCIYSIIHSFIFLFIQSYTPSFIYPFLLSSNCRVEFMGHLFDHLFVIIYLVIPSILSILFL